MLQVDITAGRSNPDLTASPHPSAAHLLLCIPIKINPA